MTGTRLTLDHIVVAATTLAEGEEWLTHLLGVPAQPGGRHELMGTHNLLWRLGSRDYIELIAIDPAAPAPQHPRWFGLDDFTGPPRLVAWVARADPLIAPKGSTIRQAARGDLRWQIAIPDNGLTAQDGLAPLLIDWGSGPHPADLLPDYGLRLSGLFLKHPEPADLDIADPRVVFQSGPSGLTALILAGDGREITL